MTQLFGLTRIQRITVVKTWADKTWRICSACQCCFNWTIWLWSGKCGDQGGGSLNNTVTGPAAGWGLAVCMFSGVGLCEDIQGRWFEDLKLPVGVNVGVNVFLCYARDRLATFPALRAPSLGQCELEQSPTPCNPAPDKRFKEMLDGNEGSSLERDGLRPDFLRSGNAISQCNLFYILNCQRWAAVCASEWRSTVALSS